MDIYRIEHKTGRIGPYEGSPYAGLYCPPPSHMRGRGVPQPLPSADGMGDVPSTHRYGFETMFQLLDWFGDPGSFSRLQANGFLCVKIRVRKTEVIWGWHQLAYLHRDQKRSIILWSQAERAARDYGIR